MFRDREDAAYQLAHALKNRQLHDPLVLAIPRGGLVLGAVMARELDAELDVILSRKIRAPGQPELAVGAISEEGRIYLSHYAKVFEDLTQDYLDEEQQYQLAEIARRKQVYRAIRPRALMEGRSVIVTDDGIATGSTMIAALQVVRLHHPQELIVAVPVASPDRLAEVQHWCDDVVCLLVPQDFYSVGEFYRDFSQIEDEQAVELLRSCPPVTHTPDIRLPDALGG